MTYSDLPLPLYHETFDVIDSSKLNSFLNCPREFFYKYILGWQEERPNIHLVFGSAWHEAMEHLLKGQDGQTKGYSADQVEQAFHLFCQTYDEAYPTDTFAGLSDLAGYDTTGGAKDKSNALNALIDYAKTYRTDQFETLYTEVAGTVPVADDRLLYFKLDSVVKDPKGSILSLEHKTTGRKSQAWVNQFSTRLQVGAYLHVLYTLYGDTSSGVIINGAILRAPRKDGTTNNEFMRIPIQHTRAMMQAWLWEVQHLFAQLDWNMQMLAKAKPSDTVLQAFPRNSASCNKFGCPFQGLCSSWANPLKYLDQPPAGIKVEYWDPRERGKEVPEAQAQAIEDKGIKATATKATATKV